MAMIAVLYEHKTCVWRILPKIRVRRYSGVSLNQHFKIMPILTVFISSLPCVARSKKIAASLSQLTQDILHKNPALTSIAIQHLDPAHWFVAGDSLEQQQKASFFLEIRITDETNTAQEKAHYIAAVFSSMQSLLGELHHESYVHIIDARATAWGYGGLTQQYRAVAGTSSAKPSVIDIVASQNR